MSRARAFDPVPAQRKAWAAEGPVASPLWEVRPFAEAKVEAAGGEPRDLVGEYVRRRRVAAATEGGGALGVKPAQKSTGTMVQRLGANEDVPSLEDQAALMGVKEADLKDATAVFFGKAVKIAKEAIGADSQYEPLKGALAKVTLKLDPDQVKTKEGYQDFWSELAINVPSQSSYLIGWLRSSSRRQTLLEITASKPLANIPQTQPLLKDHLISAIREITTLDTLLTSQFEGMVGLGMYVVQPTREFEFFGCLLTGAKSLAEAKSALNSIIIRTDVTDQAKVLLIKKNAALTPLVKQEAMTLLSQGIIQAPGGHDQLYTVLQKNAKPDQRAKLNEIYSDLEEYGDKAESQVLKKAVGLPKVTDFLKARHDVDIAEFDFQKPALTDKLLSTLFVARLLDPKMAKRYPVEKEIRGEWKNGGTLADDVVFEKSNQESLYEAFDDPEEVKEKLRNADSLLKDLVNKSVLAKIKRPQVKVDKSFDHRAYQLKDHISVAVSDEVDIIVHEVGHYLEMNYPDLWYDASLLLHSRHQNSAGLNAQSGEIGEQENVAQNQGRYQGEYPATGKYTSKIYETGGATELTSMTMEYLSTPEKARALITKDPFQALLVLRRIQPDDSDLQEIYRQYENNLPHKDPEERQRLLKRIRQHKELLTEMKLVDAFKIQLAHLETMGLPSLRILEDQMESLPTSQGITNLLENYPQLMETFETELTEARNYPTYKLNQLLGRMRSSVRG
ncbi:MAG TPA: hypothetical protein VH988_25910 [Thermoanaerobaculia bacterium]|jgi:hypothetical protein|nr:hypothetical protein [Thermoanaerobaculia bacterium]